MIGPAVYKWLNVLQFRSIQLWFPTVRHQWKLCRSSILISLAEYLSYNHVIFYYDRPNYLETAKLFPFRKINNC